MNPPTISPKRLFLIDSIGALISAFMLGFVLVRFEDLIGMPLGILHLLAILAGILCIFSFWCFAFVRARWRLFMSIIGFANFAYSCLTVALIISLFPSMKPLGILYFSLELLLVLLLVVLELRLADRRE